MREAGQMQRKCIAYLLALLCASSTVSAVTLPDSGSILQEMNGLPEPDMPRAPIAIDIKYNKKPVYEEGKTIYVKAFYVEGNTQLSNDELHKILQRYAGQNLSIYQIQQAAEDLTLLYRNKGFFVARVFIPPQNVNDGLVTLVVVEGILEKDGIEVEANKCINKRFIHNILSCALKPGQVIYGKNYERVLLNVGDLPGVTPRAILYPGSETGTGKILVQIKETPMVRAIAYGDNYSTYGTGTERLGFAINLDNPLRKFDSWELDGVFTRHLQYGSAIGQIPVGVMGLRLGARVDYLN